MVVRTRRTNTLRWIVTTLAAISWFAISNHCALGLASVAHDRADNVSKHDCCAGNQPAQPKPAKDPDAPCCKTLLATSVMPAKVFQAHVIMFASVPLDRALVTVTISPRAIAAFQFLDIGPPGRTFAECVLQASLLAHAPPFLA
jgi:hypothetical protein